VLRGAAQRRDFGEQYRLACEIREPHLFEEMREIADDGSNDWMDRKNGDGTTTRVVDHEHINRSKLRVDTIKWQLSKMNPRRFGERQLIEADVRADVRIENERSDMDAAKSLAFLLQKNGMDILPAGMKAVPIEAIVIMPGERDDTPRQLNPAQLERMKLLPSPNPQFIEGNPATPTGFVNGAIG
jgi:hypothetical protein